LATPLSVSHRLTDYRLQGLQGEVHRYWPIRAYRPKSGTV